MERRSIAFSPPDITELEIQEVAEALRSGWITTGPRTKQLEKNLAEYCHTNKVVCLNSATAAEELNLRVLGIGEGDEVLVPAYTYTASASAAIHCGATVKFIDSQKDSVEMDYDAMEAAITEKTKAVITVDLGGIPCDYDRIYQAVERKKALFQPANSIQKAIGRVIVVADCAHAIGAERLGKMAGEIADFTSFSFHAVKNFTTAEGGASTWKSIPGIDDEELYHQYQLLSLHGQSKDALAKTKLGAWEYDIIGPWYKCNMTDIMAALGLVQFERYSSMLEKRQKYVGIYNRAIDTLNANLDNDHQVAYLEHKGEDHCSSHHLYMVRLNGRTREEANHVIEQMAERSIATNVHYKPLSMMTAYKAKGFDIANHPNAFHLFENEITLPLNTRMTDEDVEYVIENFVDIVGKL